MPSGFTGMMWKQAQEAAEVAEHNYDHVNPLVRPVSPGDQIIGPDGERLTVRQGMRCDFWLEKDGAKVSDTVDGQAAICSIIGNLGYREMADAQYRYDMGEDIDDGLTDDER